MKASAKKFQYISRSRYNPTADLAVANVMREQKLQNKKPVVNTRSAVQFCTVQHSGTHGGDQRGV